MRIFWLLFLLVSPPAFAEEIASHTAYNEGRYAEAATLARTATTADGYAFSARALLAEGMCGEGQPSADLLDAAEASALAALELDAAHIEGRLQLAIALSLKARPLSLSEARKTGYAERARDLAEETLELDPQSAYAHGFLAVWNIEVVRRGGRIGSMMMGASIRDARGHYQSALALRPDDVALHWQYARALAALNARKYRSEIEVVLLRAVEGHPADALETVMAARAGVLQDALETQDRRAVEALAAEML